jgi:hypothetical protein
MSVNELQALTQKFADAFDQRDLQPVMEVLSEDVEGSGRLSAPTSLLCPRRSENQARSSGQTGDGT